MKINFKSFLHLAGFYLFLVFFFTVYSYSQIDLNLTLSVNPLYQTVQRQLIFLGYFRRNYSAALYSLLLILLYIMQLVFLKQAASGKIGFKQSVKLILLTAFILLFAYPAFSYDIFNYIFDARLLLLHKVSPWTHTALDFPSDLWTRFMHWTHRTYPYGPFWILFTIPFYLLGMGKFSLTLFWFKSIGLLSYLVCIWAIGKILKDVPAKQRLEGILLFALNPLVLIESLVNSHIDVTLTAFLLFALYLLLVKKRLVLSWLMLIVSLGIKFITAALIPLWIIHRIKQLPFSVLIILMSIVISLVIGVEIIFREILAWYFIPLIALAALLPQKHKFIVFINALSLGLMLRYVPFLMQGDYTDWVKRMRDVLTLIPPLVAVFGMLWIGRQKYSSSY